MGPARSRFAAASGIGAFAVATVALFLVSRGKWSDALVDSGREWIVPDALARGDLLYRHVVYWFGPFTPYFHAAFFEVLGSSFRTLVVAGIAGTIVAVAALHFALSAVTGRREALLWTALAVPLLVFMPNAGGSILGMGYRMWHAAAFALLAVALLARSPVERRRGSPAAAGVLAGLAGLCRTEWGLLTLIAAGLVIVYRDKGLRRAWKDEILLFGGFILVFGGVFVLFGIASGWDALLRDAPILLFNLPPETRSLVALSGSSAWPEGVWTLLYSAAMWLAVYLLMEIVALRRADSSRIRRRLPLFITLLATFGAAASLGGASSGGLVWSAAPLVCAASAVVALRLPSGPTATALFGFGMLGLLLSHRRFFFIADGPYVGPPLLLAFVCAAGLCSVAVAREKVPEVLEHLRAGVVALVVLLIALAYTARLVEYAKDERVPIRGTNGFLTARAGLAREIENLAEAIHASTGGEQGLVVFPEGEVLNFLSGRRNPIRHKLYLPGYLNAANEEEVLGELERASPAAVVVWRRALGEYGAGSFGVDYGRQIRRWIDRDYERRPFPSKAPPESSPFEYYVRRSAKP